MDRKSFHDFLSFLKEKWCIILAIIAGKSYGPTISLTTASLCFFLKCTLGTVSDVAPKLWENPFLQLAIASEGSESML